MPEHGDKRWFALAGRGRGLGCALFVVLVAGSSSGQVIEGKITRIGFPMSGSSVGSVAREGQWMPMIAELRLPGSGVFSGSIRVTARDLDGDYVEFVRTPVTLNPEAGLRRYWSYVVTFNARTRSGELTAEVLDESGAVVTTLDVPLFEYITNDDFVVLDISTQPVARLGGLQAPGWRPFELKFGDQRYDRNVCVSKLELRDLPDRWFGLESINVVVWDKPDPSMLSENQIAALIDWVARGGELILGVGDRWQSLRDSALASILPIEGDGATVTTTTLAAFISEYGGSAGGAANLAARDFKDPVPLTSARARRDANVVFRDQAAPSGTVVDLVTMRCHGSGRVTTVAGSLREITAIQVQDRFLESLLDLTPRTKKYRENEANKMQNQFNLESLTRTHVFDGVAGRISFIGQRTLFVLAALLFALLYALVATLGTWEWLKRKKMLAHSWTAFAIFAALGSIVSLGMVGITAGLRSSVQSVSLIDLIAGERKAVARAWFGYGSATRTTTALALGSSDGLLRALAMGRDDSTTYATPSRYESDPVLGLLDGVLIRATLKQLEGYWSGEMDGAVTGQITVDRRTGQLQNNSWLQNDLPQRIRAGVILYLDPRSNDGPFGFVERAAGTRHYRARKATPAALNVVAAALPSMDIGSRTSGGWARRQYDEIDRMQASWSARPVAERQSVPMPDLVTLFGLQQYWCRNQNNLPTAMPAEVGDPAAASLMLLSTRDLFLSNADPANLETVGVAYTNQGLADADISHWLIRGQAVALLWADTPAPLPLRSGDSELRIRGGVTLYRIRLPLQYSGDPPANPSRDEAQEESEAQG